MLNVGRPQGPRSKATPQNWCHMTKDGQVLSSGRITFNLFAAYPQVALENRAAHMMAISDIPEPNKQWRDYKLKVTGQKFDYAFRELYYSWTPDVASQPFSEPITIANVNKTAGHIVNQDLWIGPEDEAYALYTERKVQSALMRDKFFPGKSILSDLKLAVSRNGSVVGRRLLIEGTDNSQPLHGRFHETPDAQLYALVYMAGPNPVNGLIQVCPPVEDPAMTPVPFESPFSRFCLASKRAGNEPSWIIDVFGDNQGGYAVNFAEDRPLSYAQVRIRELTVLSPASSQAPKRPVPTTNYNTRKMKSKR